MLDWRKGDEGGGKRDSHGLAWAQEQDHQSARGGVRPRLRSHVGGSSGLAISRP